MQFLSVPLVIELHKELIVEFGGLPGIRDKGLLESAVEFPKLLYFIAMERDPYIVAASYGYHLICNHAFLDGNKRIGVLAMLTFLRMNGKVCSPPKDVLYGIAMRAATSKISEEEIANFLKLYAKRG